MHMYARAYCINKINSLFLQNLINLYIINRLKITLAGSIPVNLCQGLFIRHLLSSKMEISHKEQLKIG